MVARSWLFCVATLVVGVSACGDEVVIGGDSGRRRDGGTSGGDGVGGNDVQTGPCTDMDNDGISDGIESTADDDRDGIANDSDPDSDGDGFNDIDEAVGNYPGFSAMRATLMCGVGPDDCDMDSIANYRDTDSDNDGLTDGEELTAHTNPCAADTDGDGIDDLTERAAMSDPTSNRSMPPTGSLYVVLPYHPPGEMAAHVHREFTFSTRIRAADVFFVVDTTGSMAGTIANVQTNLMSTIVPGIVAALGPGADIRYGLAGHGDFAEGGGNYTGCVSIFQRLTRDAAAVQRATSMLRADNGGDYPEAQVPAMFAVLNGRAASTYGPGGVTRMVNPMTDCGVVGADDPVPYGWGCFLPARVPIIVLFSDAEWHNRPGGGQDYGSTPTAPIYTELAAEMTRRGAFYVGIEIGSIATDTYRNSISLAGATRTLDAMGRPLAFNAMGNVGSVAGLVVNAITQIAGSSRQDITTRTVADPMERRLSMPRTTADFIKAVTPARGIPEMPAGYTRRDMTTFYDVLPSTQVVFDVDFYNDFQEGTRVAQLFRATIRVIGRAGAEVDHRDVFIIVPATGGGAPG